MRGPCGVAAPVVVLAVLCSPSAAEGPWSWANPLPHGNPLRAVTACGGTWVAVGYYGTVYRAPTARFGSPSRPAPPST